MSYKFNPFTGKFDIVNSNLIPIYPTEPTGEEGLVYINSTDNTLYIFYNNNWRLLHDLTSIANYYLQLEVGAVPVTNYFLQLESGDYLLFEIGDKIILN